MKWNSERKEAIKTGCVVISVICTVFGTNISYPNTIKEILNESEGWSREAFGKLWFLLIKNSRPKSVSKYKIIKRTKIIIHEVVYYHCLLIFSESKKAKWNVKMLTFFFLHSGPLIVCVNICGMWLCAYVWGSQWVLIRHEDHCAAPAPHR